jgi:hypothetical protein
VECLRGIKLLVAFLYYSDLPPKVLRFKAERYILNFVETMALGERLWRTTLLLRPAIR